MTTLISYNITTEYNHTMRYITETGLIYRSLRLRLVQQLIMCSDKCVALFVFLVLKLDMGFLNLVRKPNVKGETAKTSLVLFQTLAIFQFPDYL